MLIGEVEQWNHGGVKDCSMCGYGGLIDVLKRSRQIIIRTSLRRLRTSANETERESNSRDVMRLSCAGKAHNHTYLHNMR